MNKIDEAFHQQMKVVGGPTQMDGDPVTTFLLYERGLVCVALNNYIEAETMLKKVREHAEDDWD